jgi:hypothetical protein
MLPAPGPAVGPGFHAPKEKAKDLETDARYFTCHGTVHHWGLWILLLNFPHLLSSILLPCSHSSLPD